MPWPGAQQWPVVLLLLAATVGPPGLLAEGNVGCLFSERLCLEEEWCYDDYAFGRCLLASPDLDEDDLYRYTLEREDLHQFSRELRRLFALGYRWSHGYTQCRLQALLYSTKNDLPFDFNSCSHLSDQDLEGALKVMEGQDPVDPREMAIIKYTPSVENPHASYADEVYYPPANEQPQTQTSLRERILGSNGIDIMDMEDPLAGYIQKRNWIPQMHRRSVPSPYEDQYNSVGPYELNQDDQLEFLPPTVNDYGIIRSNEIQLQNEAIKERVGEVEDMVRDLYPLVQVLDRLNLTPEDIRSVLSPERYEQLRWLVDELDAVEARNDQEDDNVNAMEFLQGQSPDVIEGSYNEPRPFIAGFDTRETQFADDIPESRIYFDENEGADEMQEYGSGYRIPNNEIFRELKNTHTVGTDLPGKNQEIFRELKAKQEEERERFSRYNKQHPSKESSGIYTEGGMVYAPENPMTNTNSDEEKNERLEEDLDQLLEKYNLGFKRPERLDVKKPGPPFDPLIPESNNYDSKYRSQASEDEEANVRIPSMMKKIGGVHPNPMRDIFEFDHDYVYVGFKQSLKSWTQSQNVIRNISALLHLEPSAFTHGRADRNTVIFKVAPNSRGLNASEVAKRIESIKDKLKERTDMEMTTAGIGDKAKMQEVLATAMTNENEFYIVIFMVCGVLGAMIIAVALLILIKKHVKSKDKLQGLSRPDTEASKDYQDLCRARMAAKGQPVNDTVHGRITSLSRESEQSPSSRSSTSSWSEEPALHNMDISTGHMVLSYMEDHLKNKDRLEQEWVALCAYVAEPCETTVALKKENVEKNRYPNVLPYDHSRVVLNELSNANNSDYINASSITDHDPRNPAYIATQGPLPHTAPDFWQLIWEQGAVVIVMLTRLTEGGAAMCHRYWPEEGSEVYHIYEVHLVSEHIWCDDYLVRSFYLKNVRTGETRTVTQFHFLSWPESGVPASTKALLEFRRKVNKSYRGRSCPIVVHCSDGAGRTGTYCLIDMVLSRMAKGAKEIDIAATLEHLRDQRQRMVATKQQFEFVLTAVAEEVHAILKALPPQPTPPAQQPEKEKQ